MIPQQILLVPPWAGLINEIKELDQLSEELLAKVCAIPNEGAAPAQRSSAADLIKDLAQAFSPSEVSERESPRQRTWELIGLLYLNTNRNAEALEAFRRLYDHILVAQDDNNKRYHKGMPVVWMSDCYNRMGYRVTAHRHLMLTLVEDGISGNGEITFQTGAYPRLVWSGLLTEDELRRYGREAHALYVSQPSEASYPEWVAT
jgi:hypothetical protein